MLPEYFEFGLPTKVVYGIGVWNSIATTVQPLGKRKALLVTDKVLTEAGPVERVHEGLAATAITIACTYDEVPPNSTIQAVEACAQLARKHQCDLIIAVGGGSVIDTAKVANILIVKGGALQEYMGAYLLKPDEKLLPTIFIPTTAGSGAEVSKVAVIHDPQKNVKLPFVEDQFLPALAVLDPEVTVSMPGKLTAATGMDALTHAIEAYVDKECSPVSDALALHAIRLINDHILVACAHPEDRQARGAMLVASFLAGVAFSHSMVGMVHGISNALEGVYQVPHGLANALVLPEVMAYNLECRLDRYFDIALALGINFPQIITESQSLLGASRLEFIPRLLSNLVPLGDWLSDQTIRARAFVARSLGTLEFIDDWIRRQAAEAGIERIRTLNRQLAYLTKMPLNLREAGINDRLAKLEQVGTTAMEDGAMLYNPREPEPGAVKQIVRTLYHARTKPLAVSEQQLLPRPARQARREMKQVFDDSQMLCDVLVPFYEQFKGHPDIGPALAQTGLCVQFIYHHPSATITIDATGANLNIIQGAFEGQTEVTMIMDADFAHQFWHGKANLISAIKRRRVKAMGNVPQILKLLPVLKPAFRLYPEYLRAKGLAHLVLM